MIEKTIRFEVEGDTRKQVFFIEDGTLAIDNIEEYKQNLRKKLGRIDMDTYALWLISPKVFMYDKNKVARYDLTPSQFILDMEDLFDYVIFAFPNDYCRIRKQRREANLVTIRMNRAIGHSNFYDEEGVNKPGFLSVFDLYNW